MQDDNPYRSPLEVSPPVAAEAVDRMQIASTGTRFANYLLDSFFFLALVFALAIVLAIIGGEDAFEAMEGVPDLVFGMILLLIYYVPQEASMGRTLGKLITGTVVVSADGGKPTLSQVIWRTLSRAIPFEPFSFLGGRGYPVGWHDNLSGTRVVRTR